MKLVRWPIYVFILASIILHCKETSQEMEPQNNSPDTAPSLLPGESLKGSYYSEVGHDIDFIFLPVESPQAVTVKLSPVKGINSYIMLYREAGKAPQKIVDDNLASLPESFGPFYLEPPGAWIAIAAKQKVNNPDYLNDYQYKLEYEAMETPGIMEIEPNDDAPSANPVTGGIYYGFFNNARAGDALEKDFFAMEINGDQKYRISVTLESPEKIDAVLKLFDEKMNLLLTIDQNGPGKNENILSYGVRGPGIHYFSVHAKNEETDPEPYRLTVESEPYDDQYEFEPNEDLEHASPLRRETTLGDFSTGNDIDYYYYYNLSTQTQQLSVELVPGDEFDIRLELLNAPGAKPVIFDSGEEGEPEAISNWALKPLGSVYFKVMAAKSIGEALATYRLVQHTEPLTDRMEREPNNDKSAAFKIIPGETLTGYINPADDIDFFTNPGAEGRYRIHWVAPKDCEANLRILNASGYVTDSVSAKTMGEEIDFPAFLDTGGLVEISCAKTQKNLYNQKYELTVTPSSLSDQF